jgi:hypothetical protein
VARERGKQIWLFASLRLDPIAAPCDPLGKSFDAFEGSNEPESDTFGRLRGEKVKGTVIFETKTNIDVRLCAAELEFGLVHIEKAHQDSASTKFSPSGVDSASSTVDCCLSHTSSSNPADDWNFKGSAKNIFRGFAFQFVCY